jgi:hypothetical protein
MNFQIVLAPTMLIAIGRKITDLLSFSVLGVSRSARTATISPTATDTVGTKRIHSRLLNSACRRSASLARSA